MNPKPNPGSPSGVYLARPQETLTNVPETELIERVLAGDPAAARQLYDAHVGAVFRLAVRMTADEQLAHDATQDAFVRVFRGLRGFRRDASLSTWIHQIGVACTLNAIRSRKRQHQRFMDLEVAENVGHTARETEPDLREQLYAAIDALPDIYRTVFVLHQIEGHSHGEIGSLLRIPEGTSKARLHEARTRLRAALSAFEGEWANA